MPWNWFLLGKLSDAVAAEVAWLGMMSGAVVMTSGRAGC